MLEGEVGVASWGPIFAGWEVSDKHILFSVIYPCISKILTKS